MEFFEMGEYGGYIWSSVSIAFAVVLIAAVQSVLRHRAMMADIGRRLSALQQENDSTKERES